MAIKPAAKKSTAKKSPPAKKAATVESPARKTATVKPQAKPVAVKKSAAKPAAASKPATKKAATVKTAARKPAASKRPAPKPAAAAKPALVRASAEAIARKSLRKAPAAGVAELKFGIESAFERRTMLTMDEVEGSTRPLVNRVIDGLESGEFRVAEPDGHGGWQVNEWLKKAVLLYFRVNDMAVVEARPAPFWDKVESRFAGYGEAAFRKAGVRVVPGAIARRGTFFGKDVVLMPSFTNIGAHVGEGTMVDTWATVGSCAQIGKHCHLSGGAGIGGVLEPLQASPTIIEDHCFIGARSEVVEGVVVGHHSVIGMGVFLSQSTRIYNRATGEVSYGYVPPYSVVVSGSLPSKDGSHSLYCAVIVKQVDARTRSKTSVNDLLRGLAD
ncbi:MAG: 2,3,4,5-tetrahydropyridine-2,6-dicarboxylate N-succinyltransferase [Stenotrophomonas sp.]